MIHVVSWVLGFESHDQPIEALNRQRSKAVGVVGLSLGATMKFANLVDGKKNDDVVVFQYRHQPGGFVVVAVAIATGNAKHPSNKLRQDGWKLDVLDVAGAVAQVLGKAHEGLKVGDDEILSAFDACQDLVVIATALCVDGDELQFGEKRSPFLRPVEKVGLDMV